MKAKAESSAFEDDSSADQPFKKKEKTRKDNDRKNKKQQQRHAIAVVQKMLEGVHLTTNGEWDLDKNSKPSPLTCNFGSGGPEELKVTLVYNP
jgi:hypothetical protein